MLLDYYTILGLPQSANQLEIKAAYRSLAKLHHPDKHGGSAEKEKLFKEINEAYSVLSHTDTKFAYDKQFLWPQQTRYQADPFYRKAPPAYRPPGQPYQYTPRRKAYANTKYVYSKWTLMYGKIFVISLIMVVVLFPVFLEYSFSNYYYNKGLVALANNELYDAEGYFGDAMRDLGGSNTLAAIKGAEMKLAANSNFEALSYIRAGLGFAVKKVDFARLHYLQGLAERNLAHMTQAEAAFQEALHYQYDQDSVYSALAPIYAYELKNYTKALVIYDSLIDDHPDDYDNYLNRGFCYQKLSGHAAAIADFDIFINNKGINGSVIFLKAVSEISLNKTDSACVHFRMSQEMGIVNARTFIKLYCEPDSVKLVSAVR